MRDTTNLNPPTVLPELAQAAIDLGFTMSSDQLTGALLRTLAASKPGGELLEMGTGVGMGTAWLLAGMDATAHLTTVDRNEKSTATARRLLGTDPRVTFKSADGFAFIRACHEQQRSFDLIFADTHPGKFAAVDETLGLLKKGGLYIIDDLNPAPKWESDHLPLVEGLISFLEQREDLWVMKFDWSVGMIVAAKK
jgi:predicted O-methyltransferase YrrM